MATIRKKGKKWQVAILKKDGFPPVYKSGFHTKQEAKDWAANEEARRQQANYFPEQASQKHTLATTIDRYVELILPSKPKSAKDTLRHLNWWKEKIGGYALARVSPDLIAQYRKELSEGLTPKGTKRSSATVNRYMASLSTVFTYAVKECGWIQTNPMLRVYKLKEARGRDRILSKDECDQLLASCAKSRNKLLLPIVVLAITTGMRRGEILNLTWNDVNLEQGILFIKETKNGKPRAVPLSSSALGHMKNLAQNKKESIPFVFPSKKRFGKISIRKAWDEAVSRCELKDLKMHDLRHTFCTYAAKAGGSSIQLQAAMGHQTSQMMDRYTTISALHTKHLSDFVDANLLQTSTISENLVGGVCEK
ncbi:MAG: site-specific integrase [Parachlamydiaceae bacterium]